MPTGAEAAFSHLRKVAVRSIGAARVLLAFGGWSNRGPICAPGAPLHAKSKYIARTPAKAAVPRQPRRGRQTV